MHDINDGEARTENGEARTETEELRRRGRPFEPGQSGNPLGRPKGSRNKSTLLAETLLEGEAEEIVRKVIEKAKGGEAAALRLCIERLLPMRRDRPVTFELQELKSAADARDASSAVLMACADGILSPDEATKVMELITGYVRTLEVAELEARLSALEQAKADNPKPTHAQT